MSAAPQGQVPAAQLRMLLDHVQHALATEHVEKAVADRVLNRLVYGVPQPLLPTPMNRYTAAQTTVAGELVATQTPGEVLSMLRVGAGDLLGRLYAQAWDSGDPAFERGHVVSWEMRFEPKLGARFGEHQLTATAQVQLRRKPMNTADMESEIDRLLRTPRRDPGTQASPR